MPDSTEARWINMEHSLYEVHMRLARSEENYALVNSKCQALTEGIIRCHQVSCPALLFDSADDG